MDVWGFMGLIYPPKQLAARHVAGNGWKIGSDPSPNESMGLECLATFTLR